jgi:DNA-binding NtrC family response regulator
VAPSPPVDEASDAGFARLSAEPTPHEMRAALARAVAYSRLREENRQLKRRLAQHTTRALVGQSPGIEALRQQLSAAAAADLPVLIEGEPGTGKELAAAILHAASDRAFRPLIKLHCGVLTSEILERELFGVPADFAEGPESRLELANGGTLLLQEVAEMSQPTQLRLLRVFESGHFEKVGSRGGAAFTARVVATSSEQLSQLVAQGLFRQDLYRFLSQTAITVPPLRERADDLAQLAEHFLYQQAVREGKPARRLPLDVLQLFRGYSWPGNVRELENLIDRACALDRGPRLSVEMVRPWLLATGSGAHSLAVGLSLREMERKLIESTFSRLGGNRERTAAELQIGIRTLSGKLREYGYPPRGGPGSNQVRIEQRAA